jgi:hypothetical protein
MNELHAFVPYIRLYEVEYYNRTFVPHNEGKS